MLRSKDIYVPLLLTIAFACAFWWVSNYVVLTLIFAPIVWIAFILYMLISRKRPPDYHRLLPPYLVALAIQFLHFTEEYLGDFERVIPEFLGLPPFQEQDWIVFNMIAYSVFILGAFVLFKKLKPLLVLPIFFILAGVVLNSLAHIGLSIYAGSYMPGLYTAIAFLLLIPLLMKPLLLPTKGSVLSGS